MGLNSRAFASSTSSDYPKKFVKATTQELDLNPSVGEIEPEIFFGPMAANFRNLQKELRQQVHIPAYSSSLDSEKCSVSIQQI
jgi:hypothetical protein